MASRVTPSTEDSGLLKSMPLNREKGILNNKLKKGDSPCPS